MNYQFYVLRAEFSALFVMKMTFDGCIVVRVVY